VLDGVGPKIEFRGPYGAAANSTMLRNVSEPTLSVFRPAKPNRVGVIVCPGGGRRLLAIEHEGTDIVRWLTAHSYTAFLLKYRVHSTPAVAQAYQAWEAELGSVIDLTGRGRRAVRAMAHIKLYGMVQAACEAQTDDGRRTVVVVSERAKDWDIDSARIGMIGLSAAAFLATDVALDPRGTLAFVAPIYGGKTPGSVRASRCAAAVHGRRPG
jgi:hypothetical protein